MNNLKFGTKLESVRKLKNMSQKELADGLCSQAQISRIEKNEVIPNAILLKSLCNKLNVSVDWILEDD